MVATYSFFYFLGGMLTIISYYLYYQIPNQSIFKKRIFQLLYSKKCFKLPTLYYSMSTSSRIYCSQCGQDKISSSAVVIHTFQTQPFLHQALMAWLLNSQFSYARTMIFIS